MVNTRELLVLVTCIGDWEDGLDEDEDDLGDDDEGLVWGPKTKSSLEPSRPSRTISSSVSS